MKNKIIVLLFLILLTGCKSKELEDRDFVMVMGIDSGEDTRVFLDIAQPQNNGDNTDIKKTILEGKGKTLSESINNINSRTSGEIFLGHLQSILVDDTDTKDALLKLVQDNIEIGRDTPVIKCDNIKKVISNDKSNIKLQDYIVKYFENNKHKKINIESYLNNNESKSNIPTISIKNDMYYIE